MCQFPSWVVKRNKVYFLTGKQLFGTERGREFIKTISPDDYSSHGTIRAWYGIDSGDGVDKECTDFSSPDNFPPEIVKAIKNGEMRGIGIAPGLLTAPAGYAYNEAKAPAWNAYNEAKATAGKAYFEARAPAWNAYNEAIATAGKAYNEAKATAGNAYNEARAPAWNAYNEAIATAGKAYNEAKATAFWDLFANPENRIEAWRD